MPTNGNYCRHYPKDILRSKGVKESNRHRMIGNGWTVDVVAHIPKKSFLTHFYK